MFSSIRYQYLLNYLIVINYNMKKLLIPITLILLLAGGYVFYQFQAVGGPQSPEFVKMTNVKFSKLNLPPNFGVTFSSDILLTNPNPFGVTVSKMDFDVFVNGKKSTHITQNKSVKIPANGEFSMPLQYKIPLKEKEMFKGISEVISGAWKKRGMDIRTEGHIYIDAGTDIKIPFSYEDEYKLVDYLK